jgi:DNA (cytosine-5)-methyltransferase 1
VPVLEALDIFCGAGGLSVGLGSAGISIVAGVELDRDAAATWAALHPDAELVRRDAAVLQWRRFDGVDLVVGGPPCQPWSTGGLRRGEGDGRDGWPAFLSALASLRPRAFLAENVAGLAEGVMRARWRALQGELAGLGYSLAAKVVNAADYGVPQKRRRLIVVGVREGERYRFPTPTHGPGNRRPWRAAGSVVHPQPLGEPNESPVTYAARPDLRRDPYAGHVYNGGGRPIDLAAPAPTLLASMGGNKTPWLDTLGVVPEYHAHLLAGGAPRSGRVPGARRITPEEAALLQSFPRWMCFVGRRSSRYRQVGNAVPPRLAEVLGRALVAQLGGRAPEGTSSFSLEGSPAELAG